MDLLITIITPCCRQDNLDILLDSLKFEYINEWIIVYDISKGDFKKKFDHPKISEYFHTSMGISGNPQRNYALTKIKNEHGYIYYLDDDNIIHPDFYTLSLEPQKIYTFNQEHDGKLRLKGNRIKIGHIDTAMFLVSYQLVKDVRWNVEAYAADGEYIKNCYLRNRTRWIHIDKTMCYYNNITNGI